ncbi:hypothetical protein FPQ18DRAFT_865 [Pyronema domesticum]|nr:hypothetical protein FPQ18DRAFT_865 [Pyronema domesticum]
MGAKLYKRKDVGHAFIATCGKVQSMQLIHMRFCWETSIWLLGGFLGGCWACGVSAPAASSVQMSICMFASFRPRAGVPISSTCALKGLSGESEAFAEKSFHQTPVWGVPAVPVRKMRAEVFLRWLWSSAFLGRMLVSLCYLRKIVHFSDDAECLPQPTLAYFNAIPTYYVIIGSD